MEAGGGAGAGPGGIERIVLGTWGIAGTRERTTGPSGYGHVPPEQADALLDAAWEAGIRQVDTAASYGDWDGVRRLASWQERRGHRFQVTAKIGRPLVNGRPVSDLSWEALTRELDAYARLIEVPEVVLLKDPPEESFKDATVVRRIEQLEQRRAGCVAGVATHRLEACSALGGTPRRRIVQLEYNGVNWPLGARVVHALARAGWELWAMQPLAYGFLGWREPEKRQFAADDWRSRLPEELRAELALSARRFQALFSEQWGGVAPAELAIAFLLADPHVHRVVVGPRSPEQLGATLNALHLAAQPEFVHLAERLRAAVTASSP